MAAVPVYSYRFIAVAGFTGEAAFLCPGDSRLVVRDIDVWFPAGGGASVQAGIGGSAVFWGVTQGVLLVQGVAQWRGRQVLNPGEQLVLSSDASVDMVASGYLLSLP